MRGVDRGDEKRRTGLVSLGGGAESAEPEDVGAVTVGGAENAGVAEKHAKEVVPVKKEEEGRVPHKISPTKHILL